MKKIIFCALCLFCAGVSLPARADNQSEARDAYQKGKEAFKAGNYREALMELSRAYKLDPRPALLRYMGDTHYKLNDARKAISTYKKYLKAAPEAADREKIQAKVRQLELIVGSGDEDDDGFDEPEDDTPATTPQPAPPPPREDPSTTTTTTTTTTSGRSQAQMAPTGEDTEDPLAADRRRKAAERRRAAAGQTDKGGSGALGVAKWVVLAGGVVGLAMGAAFQGLASGKASELQDRVKTDCPGGNTSCGGNPDMNTPVVEYGKDHWELEQSFKTQQKVATAMWITGGALAATAVVLFVVDGMGGGKKERAAADSGRRVVVAPAIGPNGLGISGQLSF